MNFIIFPQKIHLILETSKITPEHFFKRCFERVIRRLKPHIQDRISEELGKIHRRARGDKNELRELVYELFLNSSGEDEEIVYLYYISISENPVEEFNESQNLNMGSLSRLVARELSYV